MASKRRLRRNLNKWERWAAREPIASTIAPAGMHRAYGAYMYAMRNSRRLPQSPIIMMV